MFFIYGGLGEYLRQNHIESHLDRFLMTLCEKKYRYLSPFDTEKGRRPFFVEERVEYGELYYICEV